MLLGQLSFKGAARGTYYATDASGNPKPLYDDALGLSARTGNAISTDAQGFVRVYCQGDVQVRDATGKVLRDYINIQGKRFSPMNYGAVGDGVANDTAAVSAAVAAAKQFAAKAGKQLTTAYIDGDSKTYAITPISVSGTYTENGAVVHMRDFNFVPYGAVTVGSPLLTTRGNRVSLSNIVIDGQRVAGGLDAGSFSSVNQNIHVIHFRGVGINCTTSGGQMFDKCEVIQWNTSDAEYLQRDQWDGTCFRVDHADCRFTNCNGHFAGNIVEFTDDATTTLLIGCNFYNANTQHMLAGNEAVAGDFYSLQLMTMAQDSGGLNFVGCYLGNGRIDIFGGAPLFHSCIAITKYAQDQLPYFIGWHADNPNSAFGKQAVHEGWTYIGSDFANGTVGKTPFYALIEEGGNTFTGDHTAWLNSTSGTMRLGQSEHWCSGVSTELLQFHMHGLGSGATGAAFTLSDASTPSDIDPDDLPGLYHENGQTYPYRGGLVPPRRITSSAGNTLFPLFRSSSSQIIEVNAAVATTIRLPKIAQEGWWCHIISSPDSLDAVTLTAETGATIQNDLETPAHGKLMQPGVAIAYCLENATGSAARFLLSGDCFPRNPEQFNSYLTVNQINDTRSSNPVIDLTDIFQAAQTARLALYSRPTEGANLGRNAQGMEFVFDGGAYLFRSLDVWPGVTLRGANRHESRLVQTRTANRSFLVALARNGTVTRSRTANVALYDLTIQGNRLAIGALDPNGNTVVEMHGVVTEQPSSDPSFDSSYNYNSFTIDNCTVTGFSGDGIRVRQRGRLDMNGSRTQNNGGHGLNVQGPDCYINHHASGNNGQHSVFCSESSTFRFQNGEVWASNFDQDGYVAIYLQRCREVFVIGGDINSPIVVEGSQSNPDGEMYNYWGKCELIDIDFKFKGSTFTDSSDGTPFPVAGYVSVTGGYRNVHVRGVFTPAYSRTTNVFTYRPDYLVKTAGDCNVTLEAYLPPLKKFDTDGITLIDYPLWPCGAGANSRNDLVSNWNRATVVAHYPEVEGDQPVMHVNKIVGYRGGLLGNALGEGALIGEIGETKAGNVQQTSAVALTTNTVVNVASLTITPGRWKVGGQTMFGGSGLSATVLGASIATSSSSFNAADARYFSRMAIPFTTLTANEIDTRTIPPFEIDVTVDTILYLNARATFSAGTANAYGRIEAIRVG